MRHDPVHHSLTRDGASHQVQPLSQRAGPRQPPGAQFPHPLVSVNATGQHEVLRRRGVTFKFFHRLRNVRLVDREKLGPGEKQYVEALEFDVQAETTGGREYQPLVSVRGMQCWPSEPDYRQLKGGARFRREKQDFESHWDQRRTATLKLRVTRDFHFVVLAVGIGA